MKDWKLIQRLNRIEMDINFKDWFRSGTLFKNMLRQEIDVHNAFRKEWNIKIK